MRDAFHSREVNVHGVGDVPGITAPPSRSRLSGSPYGQDHRFPCETENSWRHGSRKRTRTDRWQDRGGCVALMHVAILHDDPLAATCGQHRQRVNRTVVEHAATFALVAEHSAYRLRNLSVCHRPGSRGKFQWVRQPGAASVRPSAQCTECMSEAPPRWSAHPGPHGPNSPGNGLGGTPHRSRRAAHAIPHRQSTLLTSPFGAEVSTSQLERNDLPAKATRKGRCRRFLRSEGVKGE